MQFVLIGERILLTLWVGGLWAIGYIAAPTLFAMLDDKRMAGELAGQMFQIIGYIGLVCGLLLLIATFRRLTFQWRTWVLLFMVVLVACGQFWLQPLMAELKTSGLVEGSAQAKQFGLLHGVASMLYMGTSLAGLALVIFGLEQKDDREASQADEDIQDEL